jgi:hypothetical protein
MVEINAFVAHSYGENDRELIGIFTDYLQTLANSLPSFSWNHAKWAEPEPVSSKVLAKFEGRNVLIAICTPSEYAISFKAVSRIGALKFTILKPPGAVLKTSDWILQEIGLAIGRGMKVILLLEDNLRNPGGLFGDVECIRFSRKNPQASFTKLQQMLSAPPKDGVATAVAEAKPATSDKAKEAEAPETNWNPQADWTQSRYDRAAFRAIVANRDADALSTVDTAYRESPFANGIALAIWEARIEFLRMVAGQGSNFEKIKKAVRDHPKNSDLLHFLAAGYREFDQLEPAAHTYEEAAANSDKESDKLQYLASAAFYYAEAGQWKRSHEIAEALKLNASNNLDAQYNLLAHLRDLARAEKNDILELAIMEQMVDLRPSDSSMRFALAYKHSQFGNSDMALHHYLRIPIFERDATTWNNLGVAYDSFDMPINAVSAYRASENENDTLAMCNLGFKLLGSGFLPEAQAEGDRSVAIKPHHENVPVLLKRLNEVSEEEKNKLTKTLENTKQKATFYRMLGECVLKSTPTKIAANWTSPEYALEAQMDGRSVRFFGTRQRPANALAGLLSGGLASHVVYTERIEYSGQVRGRAIFGQVKRVTDGQTPTLLALDNDVKTVMAFNEDHSEILVMEGPDSLHPRFYNLTRSA